MIDISQLKTGISLLRKGANSYPKEKVASKVLGYICPDGKVNFQSVEVAETYAKNRCVDALQGEKPFERAVIVKGSQIFAQIDGNAGSVGVEGYFDKLVGTSIFHGHPEGMPLSLMDYLTMVTQGIKKVTAYNISGEYSALIKKDKKNLFIELLPEKWQEKLNGIYRIMNGYIATSEFAKQYSKMFPKELRKVVESEVHSIVGLPCADRSKIDAFEKQKLTLEESLVKDQIEKLIYKDGTYEKVVHNFWHKVSKKLSCIYETNYSDLAKDA